MSTISDPQLICKIMRRNGLPPVQTITYPLNESLKGASREDLVAMLDGSKETPKPITKKITHIGFRQNIETIMEYTTGFGNKCWKLLYGMYATGITTETAELMFRAHGNISPGSQIRTLMLAGELTPAGEEFLREHSEG